MIKVTKMINCTKHAIDMVNEDLGLKKTYEPSGLDGQVDMSSKEVGEVDGFPIVRLSPSGDNLPPEEEGTVLIVSTIMRQHLAGRRGDLVSPDTNNAKRNERGHIISVPGFVK